MNSQRQAACTGLYRSATDGVLELNREVDMWIPEAISN